MQTSIGRNMTTTHQSTSVEALRVKDGVRMAQEPRLLAEGKLLLTPQNPFTSGRVSACLRIVDGATNASNDSNHKVGYRLSMELQLQGSWPPQEQSQPSFGMRRQDAFVHNGQRPERSVKRGAPGRPREHGAWLKYTYRVFRALVWCEKVEHSSQEISSGACLTRVP